MKVSACIIAKNEEQNLPRLLESIKGKFDEIVLVDTGSTDRTVEIAKEYGCKIYHRKWNGFADARNYAVEKATGDWIWFFDADMELEESQYENFKKILNLVEKNPVINGIRVIYRNIDVKGRIISLSSIVHIHKKSPELVWVGKIHERLVNKNGEVVVPNHPVYVNHYGYQDAETVEKKVERNLELLNEELKTLDKDKDTEEYLIKLFYLAQSYSASRSLFQKYKEKVVNISKEFIKINKEKSVFDKESPFIKHIYVYLINSLIEESKIPEAEQVLEEAFSLNPSYPDFFYLKANIEEIKGNQEKADKLYLEFVKLIDKTYSMRNIDVNITSDFSKKIEELVNNKLVNSQYIETENLKVIWKKEKGVYLSLLLSNKYLKENNKKEAVKVLDKAFKLYKDPSLGNKLGSLYIEIDQKKAEKIFTKVIEYNPSFSLTYYNLANLYLQQGQYSKALPYAIDYAKKTQSLDGLILLHELLKKNGLEEEAEKIGKKFYTSAKKQTHLSDNNN